jgi:hypothetical protein
MRFLFSNLLSPFSPQADENGCNARYFGFFILLAIALRLAMIVIFPSDGNTYGGDTDAWNILARARHAGGSAYQSDVPYNYGPIWMWLLDICRFFDQLIFKDFPKGNNLPGEPSIMYRALYVGILSLADIGIAALLWLRVNKQAALIFLFLPISIIITGRHNQMDNVAIFLALLATFLFEKIQNKEWENIRSFGAVVLLLGLSLTMKHDFIFFPLWLALVPSLGWKRRVLLLTVPYLLFFGSFLPYWPDYSEGIIQNVFKYTGHSAAPLAQIGLKQTGVFFNWLVPENLATTLSPKLILATCMLATGYALRKLPVFILALFYGITLLCFTPSMANQYHVLALPFIAAFFNSFFAAYTLFISWFLLLDERILFAHYRLSSTGSTLLQNQYISYQIAWLFFALGIGYVAWKSRHALSTPSLLSCSSWFPPSSRQLVRTAVLTTAVFALYHCLAPTPLFP